MYTIRHHEKLHIIIIICIMIIMLLYKYTIHFSMNIINPNNHFIFYHNGFGIANIYV